MTAPLFGNVYVAVASTGVRARVLVAILAVTEAGGRKTVLELTPDEVTVNQAVAWGLKRALERLGERRAVLHTNLKAVVDLAKTIREQGVVASAEPFYCAVAAVVELAQRTGSELVWMRSADEPMASLRQHVAGALSSPRQGVAS